jgi:hypothetical protein
VLFKPVFLPCFGTKGSIAVRKFEPVARPGNPSDLPTGYSHNQSVRGDIFGYYRPCSYESVFTDCITANNRGISPNGGPALDVCFHVFVLALYVAARVDNIGKYHTRPAKNIVFQDNFVVDRNVVLDLDIIAQPGSTAYIAILAKHALTSNFGPGHYMNPVPDFGSIAYLRGGFNDSGIVDVRSV